MSEGRTPSDHAVVELVQLADRAAERGADDEKRSFLSRATELLVDRGEVDAAIQLATSKSEVGLAAEIADAAGDDRRAAQLYAEAGDDERAAQAREKNGEHNLAADHWERAGHFQKAAEIHERQRDLVRAAMLYARADNKRRAADLLVRALSGDGMRRLLGAEAQEACRQAGAMYAEANELDLAVRVLKWGGQTVFAGQLLSRAGRHDDAIGLLVESGDLLAAAEAAKSAGQVARAHLLLAERAERDGRLREAAAHLEEAGGFSQAGHLYELAKDTERAAGAYERGGEFDTAAQLYERLGRPADAVRCLRAAGRGSEASALEERIRNPDASIQALVQAGQYFRAAGAALVQARAGDAHRYTEVVEYLQKVPPDDEHDLASRTLLAEVLAESGEPKRALAVLQRLFVGMRPSKEHVPAMYQYGRLLEAEGFLAGARNAYRTAAAFEPTYRDIVQRLQRLKEVDESGATLPIDSAPQAVPTLPMVVGGPPLPRAASSVEHLMPDPSIGLTAPVAPRQDSTMDLIDRELRHLTGNLRIDAPSDSRPGFPSTPPTSDVPSESDVELDPEDDDMDVLPAEDVVEVLEENPQDPPARADALAGVVLRGRFRIERKIGRGAQAQVYLARDQVLDRPVAIKVLNESDAEDDTALDRFLREARLAARVHHVGCLAIYDFGQERGLTFMAMEYFRGRTLKDLVKRGPMDPYLVVRIARDVASALSAVHAAGIVHRDVKPTNVMVDRTANVRLTDFGVARTTKDDSANGMMVGTMKYMAPEQARGKDADHRADIFSLGVVMYEMIAGKPPFGGTLDALIARVTKPPPKIPDDIEAPKHVAEIIDRCMARDPSERYDDVQELVSALTKSKERLKGDRVKAKSKKKSKGKRRAPKPRRKSHAASLADDSEDPTQDGAPAVV